MKKIIIKEYVNGHLLIEMEYPTLELAKAYRSDNEIVIIVEE